MVIQCNLFGMVKCCKGLSDLQLGDEKVTLNHLGQGCFFLQPFLFEITFSP